MLKLLTVWLIYGQQLYNLSQTKSGRTFIVKVPSTSASSTNDIGYCKQHRKAKGYLLDLCGRIKGKQYSNWLYSTTKNGPYGPLWYSTTKNGQNGPIYS